MNAGLMLRTAAIVTLLYCVAHTTGMSWTPSLSAQGLTLVQLVNTDQLALSGSMGAYRDLYFGLILTGCLALQAAVLWVLAPFANEGAQAIRLIIAAFLVAFIANALVVWEYFFLLPIVFALAISAFLILALVFVPKANPS
jgi:hypothetical protein